MAERADTQALLRLATWLSPAFPVGAFSYSGGLEQAIPPQIALTSIRLDAGGTTVHLTGSALSLEDITAFTIGLQDHPSFMDPVLAQHRAGTNGQVEFDVTLRYRRDGA